MITGSSRRAPVVLGARELTAKNAFEALYGTWRPLRPDEVARELEGFDRPWWVVGGWAIEAATGYRREHEDTDISIFSSDVPAFVDHVKDRWHVWNNVGGVLHPLGDRWPTVDDPSSQLWLRADAGSPWVVDVPLTPTVDGQWTNKVIPDHVAPLREVTWIDDGISYLLPEIALLYKARLRRRKDEPDFDATLPVLTATRRAWLREALTRVVPDHHWLDRL